MSFPCLLTLIRAENSLLLHAIQALLSEKKLHVVVFFAVSMTSQAGSNFLCVDWLAYAGTVGAGPGFATNKLLFNIYPLLSVNKWDLALYCLGIPS